MQATRLRAEDEAMVHRVLGVETPLNLFLLGMLADRGIRANSNELWVGAVEPERGELVGVALAIGVDSRAGADLIVPWGTEDAAVAIGRALAPYKGARSIVGPREAADAMWRAMGDRACRVWYDQRLYTCDQASAGPRLAIRPARIAELDLMVDWSERMNLEDLGERPWSGARTSFVEAVERRIRQGLILVAERGGAPAFKIDLGTRLPTGVQVGGTFVPDELRGQGIATSAMRGVCAWLLPRHGQVVLHANEANPGAVRAYLSAGFQRATPMRLAIAS